jgi:hypothetical protein
MINNIFCLTLCALLFALCVPAEAQQQAKVLKIGYLSAQSDARGSRGGANEVVRRELHGLGHIEGKNIVFEYDMLTISSSDSPAWPMSWSV